MSDERSAQFGDNRGNGLIPQHLLQVQPSGISGVFNRQGSLDGSVVKNSLMTELLGNSQESNADSGPNCTCVGLLFSLNGCYKAAARL